MKDSIQIKIERAASKVLGTNVEIVEWKPTGNGCETLPIWRVPAAVKKDALDLGLCVEGCVL